MMGGIECRRQTAESPQGQSSRSFFSLGKTPAMAYFSAVASATSPARAGYFLFLGGWFKSQWSEGRKYSGPLAVRSFRPSPVFFITASLYFASPVR